MAEETPGVVTSEPAAPAAEVAIAPESTADQVATPEGEEKPVAPQRPKFDEEQQKEVDRIVSKVRANESRRAEKIARAEAERDLYRRQLEELQRPKQESRPSGEPQAKDYQDWEKYQADLIDYRVEQRMGKFREETHAQQQSRVAQERAQSVQERLKPAVEKYPDFEEVALARDVPITEPMAAAISRSKSGGEIAYYLGSHLDEADRISRLDPVEQVWEIKALESKIAEAPTPTRTPAPIVPNGTKSAVDRDPSKMSDGEFNKWRRSQISQRNK